MMPKIQAERPSERAQAERPALDTGQALGAEEKPVKKENPQTPVLPPKEEKKDGGRRLFRQKKSPAASDRQEIKTEGLRNAQAPAPEKSEKKKGPIEQIFYREGPVRRALPEKHIKPVLTKTPYHVRSEIKTTPETLPKDIAQTLVKNGVQKDKSLEISLNPESLGKITIKVKAESGGNTVIIETSSQETQQILNSKAGQIGQILEHYTGTVTEIVLQDRPDTQGVKDRDRGKERSDKREKKKKAMKISVKTDFSDRLRLGLMEKGYEHARNNRNDGKQNGSL